MREKRAGRQGMKLIARFLTCGRGATAIEYAVIAGSLSIVILVAVTSTGQSLAGIFTSLLAGF